MRDTYSKHGVPSEEQTKAYIAMLGATAGLKGDVAASSIFDFSLAAEAANDREKVELRSAVCGCLRHKLRR